MTRALRPDLVLTTFGNDEYVAEALRAGAGGLVGKRIDLEELLSAIRVVAAGLSSEKIAARLFVTRLTARTHVNRAMTKLDAPDPRPTGRDRPPVRQRLS